MCVVLVYIHGKLRSQAFSHQHLSFVLQVTNAGVRRPGNEASTWCGYTVSSFFFDVCLDKEWYHTPVNGNLQY